MYKEVRGHKAPEAVLDQQVHKAQLDQSGHKAHRVVQVMQGHKAPEAVLDQQVHKVQDLDLLVIQAHKVQVQLVLLVHKVQVVV